jgi:hypothetical protein
MVYIGLLMIPEIEVVLTKQVQGSKRCPGTLPNEHHG